MYRSHWERICIKNAFLRAGFEKTENASSKYWTVMFSKHQNNSQMKELNCLQKINHFPSSWCIGRKDRLLRTINGMKRVHGRYYDFHPEGYILPAERDAFIRQVTNELSNKIAKRPSSANAGGKSSKSSSNKNNLWIVKPVASRYDLPHTRTHPLDNSTKHNHTLFQCTQTRVHP